MYLNPPRHKKQEKERRGTLETTLSLEESSLVAMAHFEIDAAYAHYNAIDTLCLKELEIERGRLLEPFAT
jgi:hypothetical protein